MSYFKELTNLSTYSNLLEELSKISVHWKDNQICLNTKEDQLDNYTLGVGSLVYDWDNKRIIIDEQGNERIDVPKFDIPLDEHDFTVLCNQFKNTLFEKLYNELTEKYYVGRVRLMRSMPKTCLSWHVDSSPRLHYPLKTQHGCFMIINDEVKFLEQSKWYWTDTLQYHTAFNASTDSRIHLVAVVLGEKNA